ncbi:MAG: beta-1,6-N-acetylglucosaminyltransferase [Bacteroidetes bacterium]|nr:beta-1,6-N-acetylglucosaminyltransferase [Bacteroidota bacterium]
MKLAYVILAHKNAPQVKRLYDRLNNKDSIFVFHICTTSESSFYKELKQLLGKQDNVFFCKREDGTLFSFTLIKGILNALNLLIKNNIEFDYVNLISGQDYPIKTNEYISDFFNKNKGKEFIEFWPMYPIKNPETYPNHRWGADRQLYRIDRFNVKFLGKKHSIPEVESRRLIDHNLYNTLKIFLFESPKYIREKRWSEEAILLFFSRILPHRRKIPENLEIYGGHGWWSITKECAEYVVNFSKKNKKFNKFFKFTLIPDEMYFQTLIVNSPFKKQIENNFIRKIEWQNGAHPIFYKKEHFPILKNTPSLFARKFDTTVDSEILDVIDKELLNFKES